MVETKTKLKYEANVDKRTLQNPEDNMLPTEKFMQY